MENLPTITSLKGTKLENLYKPIFIGPKASSTNLITTALGSTFCTALISYKPNGVVFKSKNFLSKLISKINDFARIFSKAEDLAKVQSNYNKFVSDASKTYVQYMQMHEQEISGIKENTNNINGAKYLMKKIALKKIYNKLQSLGIKCSYSEIKFQDMDLRKFPLDDNYDIVTKQNLEFQNAIDLIPKDFLALIKEYLIASRIINGIRIKKLKSKLRKLDIQFKDIKQHINADIHQLQLANVAFNNVARIYETVSETLAPMVDDILDQIHHNLNDITEDQQKSLLLMKDILKDFSEKSLEFGNETNFISNVINYNNSLSKKYLDFIDVLKHTA